jgi:hypothetical protein
VNANPELFFCNNRTPEYIVHPQTEPELIAEHHIVPFLPPLLSQASLEDVVEKVLMLSLLLRGLLAYSPYCWSNGWGGIGSALHKRSCGTVFIASPKWFSGLYQPIFQQDHARPHIARRELQFLHESGVNISPCPARSPDLNSIEHVWDLGRRLTTFHRPPTDPILLQHEIQVKFKSRLICQLKITIISWFSWCSNSNVTQYLYILNFQLFFTEVDV